MLPILVFFLQLIHITTYVDYSHLQEPNKDQNPSFVNQKVIVYTTIDTEKVSTGNSPTPIKDYTIYEKKKIQYYP